MFAFEVLSSVLSTPLIHQIRNGYLQVELCEIPWPERSEVLRMASRRVRGDFLPRRRVGETATRRASWYAATTKDAPSCRQAGTTP